jgi:outer membrane protein
LFLAASALCVTQSAAESLRDAMAAAYTNNPELGSERARLRATDEGVPQALSGFRPTATAALDYGDQSSHSITGRSPITGLRTTTRTNTDPRGYRLSVDQTLFDGFRTINRTAQAEATVRAGRGVLANTEQNVLLNAATAYLDVRRDLAIAGLRQSNIDVLREELNSTQARFDVGELTRTDVAQAEARLSRSISELSAARANVASSRATYEQVVGRAPGNLAPPPDMLTKLPRSLKAAHVLAQEDHPAILSSLHTVTASDRNVDAIEGEFLPTLSVEGAYQERYDSSGPGSYANAASVIGRLTIPLYQAGSVSSRVRQAKETSTQRRLEVETIRNQVRAAVSAAWDGLTATRAQIVADQQQVRAATVALDGVRQEAQVGQRTTLDVLNAQQELLDARVQLAITQRNEQVATFNLLAAIGQLNAGNLSLAVATYDPTIHYDGVRNQWLGVDVDQFEGELFE